MERPLVRPPVRLGDAARQEVLDVAVVGAGAAGLTAGIFAGEANPAARVALFDGADRVGAKILVAGGGRCNVTHFRVDARDYNAGLASRGDVLDPKHPHRNTVKQVLGAFTADDTVRWLASLGVDLKREETGKLFPATDKARTVLDALLARLEAVRAKLFTGHRVWAVTRGEDGFVITTSRGDWRARRVILCTGGRSLPKTGSNGEGYDLARGLGHTVTQTHPALVSMVLQQHFFHTDLSGISHDAEITTNLDGKPIDRRAGSLLWTHFGLSGPLVMDASRHWLAAREAGRAPAWTLSFLPGRTFEAAEAAWLALAERSPKLAMKNALLELCATLAAPAGPIHPGDAKEARWLDPAVDAPRRPTAIPAGLPEKVQAALLRHVAIDPQAPLAQVRRDDRRKLVHALVALPLPVEQDRGWNHAEVTAGGVPLSEVAWRTMESKLAPGLHLAGEILDVDGRIGGFNFQWAWATGHLAGVAAARAARPA